MHKFVQKNWCYYRHLSFLMVPKLAVFGIKTGHYEGHLCSEFLSFFAKVVVYPRVSFKFGDPKTDCFGMCSASFEGQLAYFYGSNTKLGHQTVLQPFFLSLRVSNWRKFCLQSVRALLDSICALCKNF